MYRGTAIIEGAKVFIDYCLKEQLPFLFLTNNSGRTPRQAADHMLKIGYRGIEPKHFYTSAMAASDTMIRRFPDKKRAYMVGDEGLREALLNNGYELVNDQADLVFIGLDKEGTWEKYSLRCGRCWPGRFWSVPTTIGSCSAKREPTAATDRRWR